MNKPIGILGGTFDPIHIGHLRMAIELREALDLAHIHIIPCYQPVHRTAPEATAAQRFAMVQCAIANEPLLVADPREIARPTPSYTIDTLSAMREEFPQTPLCLLLGIDAFLGFPSWNRWQDIISIAHIVVAHRPQYQLPHQGLIADLLAQRLQLETSFIHQHLSGGILFRPIPSLDISATEIRKQIAIGRDTRYLLPENVHDYIQQHHIYNK